MICPRCQNEIDENMNFCPYCGYKIEKCPVCHCAVIDGAHYCSHCGANLTTHKTKQYDGYYQPLSMYHQQTDQETSKTTFQDIQVNRRINKKVIIISVIVLVLITIISYVYIYNGPDLSHLIKDSQQTQLPQIQPISIRGDNSFATYTSNINQNGEVYQNNDKIYICDDQGYLVLMDRNLENREVLIDEVCQYVTVTNDAIYYVNAKMNICQASLDGKDRNILLDVKAYYMIVNEEKIYYQSDSDNEKIHVYDIKTKEDKALNDRHSYNINLVNDFIYYSSTDGIYKMNKDGQGEEKIMSDVGIGLIYQDEKLYSFGNDGKLVYYDITEGKIYEIVDNCYSIIGITDQYLFYFDQSASVKRYDLKTQKITDIYNGYIKTGYIVGDKLVLVSTSVYNQSQSSQYKIIMEFDGTNQQRLFLEQDGSFV